MHDDSLNQIIRTAMTPPAFPECFEREVWLRIAVDERRWPRSRWALFVDDLCQKLARPLPAAAVMTGMLLLGVGLGNLTGRGNAGLNSRQAYALSINPVAAAHLGGQR